MTAPKNVRRVGAREGYDAWAETYDATPNPLVEMDDRLTPPFFGTLAKRDALDAACGTGRHVGRLLDAGARVVGIDFSPSMLGVAHRRFPSVPVVLGDVQRPLPFADGAFDFVLSALVGEHIDDLATHFGEARRVLRPGGRLLFSVYHPELAARGSEANFRQEDVELRLGAVKHELADYVGAAGSAGFGNVSAHEFAGDEEMVRAVPAAEKYLGFPVLVVVEART